VLGSLGFTEIAFILVLALLLFGPKRLPEIGRTLGKGMAEFRRASNELRRTLESEVALDESSTRRPAAVPSIAAPEPRSVPASTAAIIAEVTSVPAPDAAVAPAAETPASGSDPGAAASSPPEATAEVAPEPRRSEGVPEGAA